jgi:hypothetical protein
LVFIPGEVVIWVELAQVITEMCFEHRDEYSEFIKGWNIGTTWKNNILVFIIEITVNKIFSKKTDPS